MPRTTAPKRKGNSGKGSSFEREIAKKLSLWWTEGERDDVFWRTSQSGGRSTTRAKSGKTTAGSAGDLTYLDEIGKPFIDTFLIELKRGYTKDIDILPILDNTSRKRAPMLLQFWEQAERDRKLNNRKHSLVIFKRDKQQTCILFDPALESQIQDFDCLFCEDYIEINIRKYSLLIVAKLDDFLNWVSPAIIKRGLS